MSRIVLITNDVAVMGSDGYPTGRTRFLAVRGYDEETGQSVSVPREHPRDLGAEFDEDISRWVLMDFSQMHLKLGRIADTVPQPLRPISRLRMAA